MDIKTFLFPLMPVAMTPEETNPENLCVHYPIVLELIKYIQKQDILIDRLSETLKAF